MAEITIKNYDPELGRVNEEKSDYLGFDVEGKHYIFHIDDYVTYDPPKRGDLTVPKRAFELVSYDEKTCVAKAREITDSSLLEKIAIEFHLEGKVYE